MCVYVCMTEGDSFYADGDAFFAVEFSHAPNLISKLSLASKSNKVSYLPLHPPANQRLVASTRRRDLKSPFSVNAALHRPPRSTLTNDVSSFDSQQLDIWPILLPSNIVRLCSHSVCGVPIGLHTEWIFKVYPRSETSFHLFHLSRFSSS